MHKPTRALDRWTVIAIAAIAYCVANVIHEGGGHGVACVLVGGRTVALNAIFFDCDKTGLSPGAARWVAAAGSLVNVVVGTALLAGERFPDWQDGAWAAPVQNERCRRQCCHSPFASPSRKVTRALRVDSGS